MPTSASDSPRYEPHEGPPPLLSLGLGLQSALLIVAPIVLFPLILAQSAGVDDAVVSWSVFAMLAVNGATIMLQAVRIGPVGCGLMVLAFPSSISIPFCVVALVEGGPAVLAALILISGLFQIAVSFRLSYLRRIVTPTVSGTVIILLAMSVMAVVLARADEVPDGAPAAAAPACMAVTGATILGLLLRGPRAWRMWAPLIGIAAGGATALAFGVYDLGPAGNAPPAGVPLAGWPGPGLDFGPVFWSLLPAFLFLSVITVLQGNSIALSVQQVSWRRQRALDYRLVQGATICTGIGNLLAALAVVMPITTAPRGTTFVQQTGCASRQVALITGAALIATAFLPKVWGVLVGMPGPVSAIFLMVVISPLFVEGMRLIMRDAPDYRTGLVVGVALAVGLGFQFELLAPPFGGVWRAMLQNGLTAGGVTVILLTAFTQLGTQGRRRIQTELGADALDEINAFLEDFARRRGWDARMADRLQVVADEVLVILGQAGGEADTGKRRKLLLLASGDGRAAELEFVSAPRDATNLEDRIALLTRPSPGGLELDLPDLETMMERDVPLRLLQHYASSVTHRQYHETEVITVRVAAS